jgi:hypothetical protein
MHGSGWSKIESYKLGSTLKQGAVTPLIGLFREISPSRTNKANLEEAHESDCL